MLASALLLAALLCSPVFGLHEGIATFNRRGISGRIIFTVEGGNGPSTIRVTVELEGLRENHNWHVHRFPVDQTLDATDQCDGSLVGGHYNPFGADAQSPAYADNCVRAANKTLCEAGDLTGKLGQLDANGKLVATDNSGTLFLSGRYGILGRSVVIHSATDGSNFVCGTIRPMGEITANDPVTLLQATFISPIAGTMYFRQVSGQEVQIWGRLFWVDDTNMTTSPHNWHIHESAPGEDYRVGMCGDVGPHYDPTGRGPTSAPNYSTLCTPDTPDMCEIGDLTGKHGQLRVSETPDVYSSVAFFFTDSALNLVGTNPALSSPPRAIAVHRVNPSSEIVACAPLLRSERLVVTQFPEAFLRAAQDGPFEPTHVTTSDSPFSSLSVLNPAFLPGGGCLASSPAMVDGTYDPFITYTGEGVETPDRRALGSISDSYTIRSNGLTRIMGLPVYGNKVTIANRPLAGKGFKHQQCSTLLPYVDVNGRFPTDVVLAKATFSKTNSFSGRIGGAIYFMQRDLESSANGYTFIIVDLYYTGASESPTTGHNWHVHENPPMEGAMCGGTIGGHFNPFFVNLTNPEYGMECTRDYPLRCESGDLSSKHGQLSFSTVSDERPTFSYVDPNVNLIGTYTIIGRSIGLHLPASGGGSLFSCAPVKRSYPASQRYSVSVNEGAYTRILLTEALVDTTTVEPSDILLLSELVVGGCSTFAFQVLGDSQSNAEANRATVVARASSLPFYCEAQERPTEGASAIGSSLLLLAACLLLSAIIH